MLCSITYRLAMKKDEEKGEDFSYPLQQRLLNVLVAQQVLEALQLAHGQPHLRVVGVQQRLQRGHLDAQPLRAGHLHIKNPYKAAFPLAVRQSTLEKSSNPVGR